MKWGVKKKYFLYLKDSNLIGVEWQNGNLRKVIDTTVDDLSFGSEVDGEAILLLNKESLQHQIISVPTKGKVSLKKIMAHEVESLMGCPPSELIFDWRVIGSSSEEGVPQTLYLLAAHRQSEIIPTIQNLRRLGFKLTKIISFLDLLIEKGKALQVKGGSGLMIFEEPLVHFLFFRDGVYGFQRSFELREEGFQKDFLLEIQRSFFYTKQKFKTPIEKVSVILSPEWLQNDLADQLQETLGVPIDFLSPHLKDCEFPEIKLLNILINEQNLISPLLNLMPPEIIREMETQKLAWAVTLTEVVLLCLVLLWTYNNKGFLKNDTHYYNIREKQLKLLETNLINKKEKIERLKKLEEETKLVKEYLKQKKYLHLYLKSLSFLVPEKIHLESISWGNNSDQPIKATTPPSSLGQSENGNIITLIGKVDSPLPDEKYSLFFKFLGNLESSPFVEKVNYHSEDLLTQGLFQIDIYLKEIQA